MLRSDWFEASDFEAARFEATGFAASGFSATCFEATGLKRLVSLQLFSKQLVVKRLVSKCPVTKQLDSKRHEYTILSVLAAIHSTSLCMFVCTFIMLVYREEKKMKIEIRCTFENALDLKQIKFPLHKKGGKFVISFPLSYFLICILPDI